MDFYAGIKTRRSIRDIEKISPISDERIEEILAEALKHTPTAFNAQGGRIVLALGKHHDKVWEIVAETLKEIVPDKNWEKTREKLEGFKRGHGTVLFFKDEKTLADQQEKMPLYADKFKLWADESMGMLQYVVWTSLSIEGLGASLQHYNPLIDDKIREYFNLEKSWKLDAQMPFGTPLSTPGEKTFKPLEERLKIFKE